MFLRVAVAAALFCIYPPLQARENLSYRQEQCLRIVLSWILDPLAGHGRMPGQTDLNAMNLPMRYNQLVGKRPFHPEGRRAHEALFTSPRDFWLELRNFARAQDMPLSLLRLRTPPKSLLPELQEEAHQMVLDWILDPTRGDGNLPHKKHFGLKPGQIPVSYDRISATNQYAPGKAAERAALFANAQDFWIRQQAYARTQGFGFSLLSVHFKSDLSPEMRHRLQQEAHALVLDWIRNHNGVLPTPKDFGSKPGQIPIEHCRLTARNMYAPYKPAARAAVFASAEDFWLQHKAYACSQGASIQLLDVLFSRELLPETRSILQQEALEHIVDWIRDPSRGNGRKPTPEDIKDMQIHLLSYQRLTGTGVFRSPEYYGMRLFDSVQAYKAALARALIDADMKKCDALLSLQE